jgi:hypothetical protein
VLIFSVRAVIANLRILDFNSMEVLGMVQADIANLLTTTCRLAVGSRPTL